MMKNYILTNSQDLVSNSEYVASYVTYTSQDKDKHRINVEIIKTNPIISTIVLNEHNELALIPVFQPAVGQWVYEIPYRFYLNREQVITVAEKLTYEKVGLPLSDATLLTNGPNVQNPKTNTNLQVVFGRVQTFLNGSSEKVRWVDLRDVYHKLKKQLQFAERFMDGLYLGGLTTDALLIYKLVEG